MMKYSIFIGTSLCISKWLVNNYACMVDSSETVAYFFGNGSEVYTFTTDMSEACDMNLHSLMLSILLDADS